ncbi:hypothetical protein BDZ45DRAFT_298246 [Acephala macrosclerotiorum]|nr:hypothetical protein BDZ45DRAFT_298246 [Acephala macrosclerotiorum]
MHGTQKRTYLVYSRGMQPDEMLLGSLYLDPANPLDGERKRFDYRLSDKELQDWAGEPEIDEPCSLRFISSREWLVNAGVMEVLGGKAGTEQSEEIIVCGMSGRRLQVKRPESFLNEVVLSSPKAIDWLRRQLSVSRAMFYSRKMRIGEARYPRIWLLTGIQYIREAGIVNTKRQSIEAAVSLSMPPPDPVAAAVSILTGQNGLTLEGEGNMASATNAAYYHKDERVWAAQFTPLDVRFSRAGRGDEAGLLSQIQLRSLPDLGSKGVRGDEAQNARNAIEEVASVIGLDVENMKIWDNDPETLLNDMEDVEWGLLESYMYLGDSTRPGEQ